MSDEQYYYGEDGGEVRGPLPLDVIRTAIDAGRLSRQVAISWSKEGPWELLYPLPKEVPLPDPESDKLVCPMCGSSNLHAGNRGWSYATGFIGSGKVFITCLKCGSRFKPGQVTNKPFNELEIANRQQDKDNAAFLFFLLFVVILVVMILVLAANSN